MVFDGNKVGQCIDNLIENGDVREVKFDKGEMGDGRECRKVDEEVLVYYFGGLIFFQIQFYQVCEMFSEGWYESFQVVDGVFFVKQ